jgi:hypothetical protein
MKKLIVLTFAIIWFSSCSQDIEDKIQGNWLMTYSQQDSIDKVENPLIYSSYLISINRGQLTISHINYEETFTYKYIIENQNIILDDSTVFQIVSLPPNTFSLRIDKGHIHDLVEIPFGNYHFEDFDPEILHASSWLLTIDEYDYEFRLEFSKSKHTHSEDSTFELFSWAERELDLAYVDFSLNWRFFNFQNQSFLSLALFPGSSVPYQIINYSKDTIYLKTCFVDSCIYPYIHKIEGIPKDSLTAIREILLNRTWKATNIDYPEIATVDFVNKRIAEETTKYVEKHHMSFNLKGDSFATLINETILDNVSWDLTEDGKFIKLFQEDRFFGYIEIVEISIEQIVLSNSTYFSYLMNLQDFASNTFKITMQ